MSKRAVKTLALLAMAGVVALTAAPTAPAFAVDESGNAQADVGVEAAITLTDLTPSFAITGHPGDTVATVSPVTMIVHTNNLAGYSVTVQPVSATLDGALVANTASIPMTALQVKETTNGTFTPLIVGSPVVVATKASPSLPAGDLVSNTYQLTIPLVPADSYSGTLTYLAATL